MLRRAETFHVSKTPRDIAAPFQSDGSSVTITIAKEVPRKDFVDYTNFSFEPLDAEQSITFEKYCGPTPESNWVIPGVLLVGAYPASQDDGETFELITSILKLGITKFYRSHGVTEEMWRSGNALRPYFDDVRLVVQLKASIPELNDFRIVDEQDLSFVHFPIKDCGITDDNRVLELAKSLVKAISEKEVLYLHCWGGHGRTGTLVCIMLHLMYGLSAPESMARCQLVHDLRQCPVQVGSPQTQPQRDQVTRIIKKLASQTQVLRRTMSDLTAVAPDANVVNVAINEHSPRSPDAAAITHSMSIGHPHFPLGTVHAPSVEPNQAESQSVLDHATIVSALSATEELADPWDAVPQYEDVESDDEPGVPSSSELSTDKSFRADDKAILEIISSYQPPLREPGVTADFEFEIDDGNIEDSNEEVRQAAAVDCSPTPPGSIQPSAATQGSQGGIRNFRKQK